MKKLILSFLAATAILFGMSYYQKPVWADVQSLTYQLPKKGDILTFVSSSGVTYGVNWVSLDQAIVQSINWNAIQLATGAIGTVANWTLPNAYIGQ